MIASRRVLMINYNFPPEGGVACQRAAMLSQHLPRHGWSPTFLAGRWSYARPSDPSVAAKVPAGTRIVRVANLEPGNLVPLLPDRVKSLVNTRIFPDLAGMWLRPALSAARQLLADEPYDLIFASGSPWTSLLVGRTLKAEIGLPFVAEFRDLWAEKGWTRQVERERTAERSVVEAADGVVVVNELMSQTMSDRYAPQSDRICCVMNGFDPDDFSGAPQPLTGSLRGLDGERRPRFLMSSHGTMIGLEEATGFLRALSRAARDNPSFAADAAVLSVGGYSAMTLDRLARGLEPRPPVQVIPRVPHSQSVSLMRRSDVLLLIRSEDWHTSAKIFDYLAAGRPVLALVPEPGSAADLIRKAGAGIVADPLDEDAITAAILDLYERWRQGDVRSDTGSAILSPYRWGALVSELAEFFDEIVG